MNNDEKAILRNIDLMVFDRIGRTKDVGDLYLRYTGVNEFEPFWWCNHLFQFIKFGEEYSIKNLMEMNL